MRDPAAYGSFDLPPGRPRRIRDRCPECSRALEWADERVDAGADSPPRWIGAVASCECGLELRWDPNQTDLVEARRRSAAAAHHGELASDQLRLV